MSWKIKTLPEVDKDFESLEGSQRNQVTKVLRRVSQNPVSSYEGGYGKPLGNHNRTNLAGCFKIKINSCGIRIVYKLERTEEAMNVIVIGARADDEVYEIAQERIRKYSLMS